EDVVSLLMISQGSSGNSICFGVAAAQADQARNTVEREFFAERMHGQIRRIDVTTSCSILAVVSEGMARQPNVTAKFFTALEKTEINLRTIAQNTTKRNISIAVDAADTQRALRTAHADFYLYKQNISIKLVGIDNIGNMLLHQLSQQLRQLKEDFDIN